MVKIINVIVALLILLWVYTALSKVADIGQFKSELHNQAFGSTTAAILLWLIPISEMSAVALLLFKKTQLSGLLLSLGLMIVFTAYITLVLIGYYDRVPCSCGGVLKQLGWQAHFWFNLFFLVISAIGTLLRYRLHKKFAFQFST